MDLKIDPMTLLLLIVFFAMLILFIFVVLAGLVIIDAVSSRGRRS